MLITGEVKKRVFLLCLSQGCFPCAYHKGVSIVFITGEINTRMFPLCLSQGCFPCAYHRRGQYKDVSLVLMPQYRSRQGCFHCAYHKDVSLMLMTGEVNTRMFPLCLSQSGEVKKRVFLLCLSQGCFPCDYQRRGQYKDVSLVLITGEVNTRMFPLCLCHSIGQGKDVSIVHITRMFPLCL